MSNTHVNNSSPDALAVSVKQAVARCGLGRTTLYELMDEGTLPFVKLGARRLILIADLTALLLAHRTETKKQTA